MQTKPCIVGIDFGTTSLSAVVIDTQNKRIEKVLSYNTDAFVASADSKIREQSVAILSDLFSQIIDEVQALKNIRIVSYGFTGQMHGIIGIDKEGNSVTNLVTWQDQRGDSMLPSGISILETIRHATGNNQICNGYGIVALYQWIVCDKRKDIAGFCTVPDYFARRFAQSKNHVMDQTMAHSIGLFDIKTTDWDTASIEKLGLPHSLFPKVTTHATVIGYTNDNVPVSCSIGDNQASFLGSILSRSTSLLLNIGTGTQLSFLIKKEEHSLFQKHIDEFETQLRPFNNDSYLVVTAFLSGGSVYKYLFNFFKETASALFGIETIDENKLWENMERMGRKGLSAKDTISVSPLLDGQRKNPQQKGSIENLSSANFHPEHFIAGFLKGLANYYKTGYVKELDGRIEFICGSGNGLKRNPLLKEILEETFERPVLITAYNEEASVGAALNGALACNLFSDYDACEALVKNLSE